MDKNIFNVNGYYLDNEQIKAVICDSKYLLINAGAGSGKTLTSFKTSQLASKLDFIDKVLFVVDRNQSGDKNMQEIELKEQ